MPISIVENFNLDAVKFEKSGAFNAMTDWDSRFFVDPRLLLSSKAPEFVNSQKQLLKYFQGTIKLIVLSKEKEDKHWRNAEQRLIFSELGAFGLGYADASIKGSGIGPVLAKRLMNDLNIIVSAGINDPELFELMSLFEKGISNDLISDMICNILINTFASFTDRVFSECGYNGERVLFGNFSLPPHPTTRTPIFLAPEDILTGLPTAENEFKNLGRVLNSDDELRNVMNGLLGSDWKKQVEDMKKEDQATLLTSNCNILESLLIRYKEIEPKQYDFKKDPVGEYSWREPTASVISENPLNLNIKDTSTLSNVHEIAKQICNQFKDNVENNGAWEILWNLEKTKRRPERTAQKAFFMTADAYCTANNLDISPESNAGQGPVDFKCSKGLEKVVIEMKFEDNPKIIPGFEKQTLAYQKSEKSQTAIYVVLLVKESSTVIDNLNKVKNKLAEKGSVPEIIYIDAQIKKSASNL